ncbi:putative methyltransferase family protein [Babesia bovis T2Bo]|uniref:protein-histidine N-methyltransferase n=1 Tax=Babesia bovis TaxID=5865 RepID=A7AWI6_BABBO|nr:putative methyltransferase family protein [Babesia bovis T2Bo]EDO05414.1 putative methyltransferase family protein [Babesia bovis T2Bo]|eukprot:XP_001608982.1 hypothetical protein [Babesia bovis T2Bo]
MESITCIDLSKLLIEYTGHVLDLETIKVSRYDTSEELSNTEKYSGGIKCDPLEHIKIRIANIPQDKRTANVKRRKYEGGFTIWESTWLLAAFIEKHVKPGNNNFAIDLGCGNGICGILALRKNYNVLFQDLNWDVLQESVIPNCLLNSCLPQLISVYRKRLEKDVLTESVHQDSGNETSSHVVPVEQIGVHQVVNVTFESTKDNIIQHSRFIRATVRDKNITPKGADDDKQLDQTILGNYTISDDKSMQYELLSTMWEDMPTLSTSILSNRMNKCALIVAGECLYRQECYDAIAKVIHTYLCPETGVAYIGTKRVYFGMDGGTFEFISFIKDQCDLSPKLTAKVCKSHRTPGSTNIIDIIEVRFDV